MFSTEVSLLMWVFGRSKPLPYEWELTKLKISHSFCVFVLLYFTERPSATGAIGGLLRTTHNPP